MLRVKLGEGQNPTLTGRQLVEESCAAVGFDRNQQVFHRDGSILVRINQHFEFEKLPSGQFIPSAINLFNLHV